MAFSGGEGEAKETPLVRSIAPAHVGVAVHDVITGGEKARVKLAVFVFDDLPAVALQQAEGYIIAALVGGRDVKLELVLPAGGDPKLKDGSAVGLGIAGDEVAFFVPKIKVNVG